MDFKDLITQHTEKISKLKGSIETEEATKNAFIMPFIQILGYDVFNPLELIPEMVCDIGMKKGEKIDYTIVKNGEPIILIECKHWNQDLSLYDNQLLRYFHVSKAKFGILTNGIKYRFYTDLEVPNKMDEKPFLEFDFENIRESQIEELKKFHKSYFDLETILSTASELKYASELKQVLVKEFLSPSPEFAKVFAKKVYEGMITPKISDQFKEILKHSISSHINDIISERLKTALKTSSNEDLKNIDNKDEIVEKSNESKIITTDEEMEGYFIVKSIVRSVIAVERVTHRDAQSYFSIFIDNNNRKLLCRLHFISETNLGISFLDENKKENKYKIEKLDDIYNYSEDLIRIAGLYTK
ncbi:MAG: type I restriction endonuclease [Bacteroidales bacterium]|nr:type I restriction endonuclease [Bacteroidales bacterium]